MSYRLEYVLAYGSVRKCARDVPLLQNGNGLSS